MDGKQAEEIALDFLSQMGIEESDVRLSYMEEIEYREPYTGYRLKPSSYQVQFLSTDGENMIGGSFFDLSITRAGVVFAHGLALEVVRASGETLLMPRMPDALLILMGQQEDQYNALFRQRLPTILTPIKTIISLGMSLKGKPCQPGDFSLATVR